MDKVQSEIDLTHPIIHPSIWASGGATSISDGIILFVCYQWHFVLNTWSVHNLSTEMLNVKLRLQSKTFTLNSTKRKACKLWQFGELELRDMYIWRQCWQLSFVNRIWHYMSKSKEWVNFANFCVLPYLFICRCSLNYWGLLFAYLFSTYAETFNAKMPCALCPIRISGKTAT